MYIIAGLGNPGKQYEKNRHNIGFRVIDALSNPNNIEVAKKKHKALLGSGQIGEEKVVLIKPQTFMNLSGEAIEETLNFYKEDSQNLIVIFDDVDLPFGKIRIKQKGSAGTHNGVKSIIENIGAENFIRVKIGIGPKELGKDLIGHVLGDFSKEQENELKEIIENAKQAVEMIIKQNIIEAMNKYN